MKPDTKTLNTCELERELLDMLYLPNLSPEDTKRCHDIEDEIYSRYDHTPDGDECCDLEMACSNAKCCGFDEDDGFNN